MTGTAEKTAHTPGPWRAIAQGGSSTVVAPTMPGRNDRRSEVTYGYKEGGDYCIAYPFMYQVEPGKSDEQARMDFVCFSHADARLIAAAPDMLAALKKASQLASIACDWHLEEVEIDGDMVDTHDLRDEFDAAIAKASA